MKGYFDAKGNPRVRIGIGGRKKTGTIDAIFDTGCSGYLVLPISVAIPLGLELMGAEQVEYGDGRITDQCVFQVSINIDGEERLNPAILTGGKDALVGISLFKDYSINIDFKNKKIEITKAS